MSEPPSPPPAAAPLSSRPIIDVEAVDIEPDPGPAAAGDDRVSFVDDSDPIAGAGDGAATDEAAEEPEDDGGYHPVAAAIVAAAIFLTRLPLTFEGRIGPHLFGRAMGWFPLIGAGLGLGAGLAYGLFGGFGLPPLLAAVLTVTLLVVVTGALHEDGLADTVDGFGGRDLEGRLDIMRDSRIGSYGSLALVLSVAVRVAAVAALPTTWIAVKTLVVAGAVSRAAPVAVAHWLPPARRNGLAASLAGPAKGATLLALALAVGVSLLLLRAKAVLVLLAAAVVTVLMMRVARLHAGGHTGDLLGATQQAVEIVLLVLLVGLR